MRLCHVIRPHGRGLWLLTLVLVLLAALVPQALAGEPRGVYRGSSRLGRRVKRYVKIAFDVTHTGTKAKWDLIIQAPCGSDIGLGYEMGTDQRGFPPLRLHDGRFKQFHHSSHTYQQWYYTLAGHMVQGGFVGTFAMHQYVGNDGVGWCYTHVIHWRARHTSRSFSYGSP